MYWWRDEEESPEGTLLDCWEVGPKIGAVSLEVCCGGGGGGGGRGCGRLNGILDHSQL